MLHALKLLLPALIPSWNFFDVIAPSPRIEYVQLGTQQASPAEWQEFRPRPARLGFLQMLARMVWNTDWNEYLFMMSCAERLIEFPTSHSEHEILKRIIRELLCKAQISDHETRLGFRLLTLKRTASGLEQQIVYESRLVVVSEYYPQGDRQ